MKPQKALHLYQQLEKENPNLANKGFMIFEKYDGWYGYLDVGQSIMSRQMREIPSLEWLSQELRKIPLPQGRMIFEILVKDVPVFKDLNGILNRKQPAKDAYLVIHDFLPIGAPGLPFSTRFEYVKGLVDFFPTELISIMRIAKPIQESSSADPEYWHEVAEEVWERGGEGIILKDLDAPYSPGKRNADILKIKMEHSEEMVVTGVHVGQGKYSKTLGYLLVKDVHGVTHKVSGMTDAERDLRWKDMDLIIGQVVEVQFMQRLANGSLREPRFKAVRHDKTVQELG